MNRLVYVVSLPALAACTALAGIGDLRRADGVSDGGGGNTEDGSLVDAATDVATDAALSGLTCLSAPCVTQVACGAIHTCALRSDGIAYCWGSNNTGQLGLGPAGRDAEYRPTRVAALKDVSAVYAGGAVSCATTAKSAHCWGGRGNGTPSFPLTAPTEVPELGADMKSFSAGGQNACAVRGNGAVQCWGPYTGNSPSDPWAPLSDRPSAIAGVAQASAVATGGQHMCALLEDGRVQCWGYFHPAGVLAGKKGIVTMPFAKATAVAAGSDYVCALGEDTIPMCLYGLAGPSAAPQTVRKDLAGATGLIGASKTTCAIEAGSGLACWTDPSLDGGASTTRISGLPDVVDACLGDEHGCVVTRGGVLSCWGNNRFGQIGDGTLIKAEEPVIIKLAD